MNWPVAPILVVDDEEDIRAAMVRALTAAGAPRVDAAVDGKSARARCQSTVYDVVALDLGLPDIDGLLLLQELVARDPETRVVVISGYDGAQKAVSALKAGALEYLVKPWKRDEFVHVVRRAAQEAAMARALEATRRGDRPEDTTPWISRAGQLLEDALTAASNAKVPVLLLGESGCGKEIAARSIHRRSRRAQRPYVTLNAACLAPTLLESEIFGHEAGAFTGALQSRRGLFELAAGGTLFLDEIGELPLSLQPKLLRVLEGHPFRRLGGERELQPDVRLIFATHRDLGKMVAQGEFRADLYYRLKVMEIRIPPLRDRLEDLPLLIQKLLPELEQCFGAQLTPPQGRVLERLERYHWPGNIRELRNVLERAWVLAQGQPIQEAHLPGELRAAPQPLPVHGTLDQAIQSHVLATWAACGHNLSRTAQLLDISRVALRRRLRAYGQLAPAEDAELVRSEPLDRS